MKKIIALSLIGLFFMSCSKDDSNSSTPLTSTPDAKAEFDTSNYGIYKGVFVGSSGIVTININNAGTISATLVIDGTSYTYTTTEAVTAGSTISNLTFTNGSSSFDFNVSGNGGFPEITNVNIVGHPNATIELIKEYSDAIAKCYEGTYTRDASGVFNLIISDGYVHGLARDTGDTEAIGLQGGLSGTTITGSFEGGTFTGTVNGNSVSGTYINEVPESGNWSGHRSL